MHALIRLLYSFLIAGSLIAFVAVGISTFSQAPKYPEYPSNCYNNVDTSTQVDPCQAQYDKIQKDYDKKSKSHEHTLALASLPAAVLALLVGVYLIKRSEVIGEGIALGGIGIAVYAIVNATEAQARIVTFASLTVLLAGALLLGWRRFASKEPIATPTFNA